MKCFVSCVTYEPENTQRVQGRRRQTTKRTEVSAHDAVPGRMIFLVKFLANNVTPRTKAQRMVTNLFDKRSDVLFDAVFAHSLRCTVNGFLENLVSTPAHKTTKRAPAAFHRSYQRS